VSPAPHNSSTVVAKFLSVRLTDKPVPLQQSSWQHTYHVWNVVKDGTLPVLVTVRPSNQQRQLTDLTSLMSAFWLLPGHAL
jgi:hypothetical protein